MIIPKSDYSNRLAVVNIGDRSLYLEVDGLLVKYDLGYFLKALHDDSYWHEAYHYVSELSIPELINGAAV